MTRRSAVSGLAAKRPLAAEADALDQAADEDVRAQPVERTGGGAVELQERAEPIARGRGAAAGSPMRPRRGDHVQLAAPGDGRERARSTERSSTGGLVSALTTAAESAGIGERPQPGDRVAHLGTLEEGGRPGAPEWDVPFLERGGDQPALARGGAGEHAISSGRLSRREPAPRSRGPPPALRPARWRSARTGPSSPDPRRPAGPARPTIRRASTVWQAVTPEPQ